MRKLGKLGKIAILGGVAVATVGGILLLVPRGGADGGDNTVFLNFSHGLNGTTDPPAGQIPFPRNSYVTLKAFPDESYIVNGWTVGETSQPATDQLTLKMDKDHNVTVTFTTQDPTPRIPYQLLFSPLPPLEIKQAYKAHFTKISDKLKFLTYPIQSDDYLNALDGWLHKTIEFTVVDRNNAPCPNTSIRVYATMVDSYYGAIHFSIDDSRHTVDNPLLVFTGVDGKAQVGIFYANTDLDMLVNQRCYLRREYFYPPVPPWTEEYCLHVNELWDVCEWGINACIREDSGTAFDFPCPNATVYGPQYEYQTGTYPHTLTAYIPDTTLAISYAVNTRFGIRNLGL